MPKRKPTQIVQVGTRMPESLRVKLEKVAKSQAVSLNAEIVRRLERSFEWETLEEFVFTKIEPILEAANKGIKESLTRVQNLEAITRLYGEVPTHAEYEASTLKAELVVEGRHLSGNPNMQIDEALAYLAERGNAQAKAILTEIRERRLEEIMLSARSSRLKRA